MGPEMKDGCIIWEGAVTGSGYGYYPSKTGHKERAAQVPNTPDIIFRN
jgi:hypothetical protein